MSFWAFIRDAASDIASHRAGPWSLSSPNSLSWDFGGGSNLCVSFDTNFKSNFTVGFKFTF